MSEFIIDTSQPVQLDWGVAGISRKIQNVLNLISTFRYEVAYDRTMGVDPAILDMPADKAAAFYASEVHRLVNDYQPDIKVKSVELLSISNDGNLQFKVVINIG